MLPYTAPERQRLLERQADLLLPELQHRLLVVREEPDIEVLLRKLHPAQFPLCEDL
jgi:3-polyprenyl-4-hydroxybenzoate decarboxylase